MMESATAQRMRVTDLCPHIPRAGKVTPAGDKTEACLQEAVRAPTPPAVRKVRNNTAPELGAVRVHRGRADDPDVAGTLVHGVCTKSSITGGSLLNPPMKTLFQNKLQDISEAIYASSQKSAVGMSQGRHKGIANDATTYGIKTVKGLDLRTVVNPTKTAEELESETQEGHESYIRTHNAYFVGEKKDRKYDWSRVDADGRFGKLTPHFNDGRNLCKSIRWQGETQKFANSRNAWRRSGHKDTTDLKSGRGDTLNVPPDHAFGLYLPPDRLGVGGLIHNTEPGQFMRWRDRHGGVVCKVRHHLKKISFHNFPSLLQAFRHYDKKGKGRIDKEDLRAVCKQFQLGVSEPVLDSLMSTCDSDSDGLIDFVEFSNFLSWKGKMPINTRDQSILNNESSSAPASTESSPSSEKCVESPEHPSPKALVEPGDLEPVEPGSKLKTARTLRRPRAVQDLFKTSSTIIGDHTDAPVTTSLPRGGIPTVRSDLPAPRLKSVCDHANYGDLSTARDLLHPSIHSLLGVHEKHFFSPRTEKEIISIFQNVCEDVSEETLEEAWRLASMKHPTGEVCVQSFTDVLEEIKAM